MKDLSVISDDILRFIHFTLYYISQYSTIILLQKGNILNFNVETKNIGLVFLTLNVLIYIIYTLLLIWITKRNKRWKIILIKRVSKRKRSASALYIKYYESKKWKKAHPSYLSSIHSTKAVCLDCRIFTTKEALIAFTVWL